MSNTVNKTNQENVNIDQQDIKVHLAFTIDKLTFATDIMMVKEIKGWSEPTPIPNSSPHLLGAMNLRGQIIPIFDLFLMLNKSTSKDRPEIIDKNVIIMISIKDKTVGLLVDSISDILNINMAEIQPIDSEEHDNGYIEGLVSVENKDDNIKSQETKMVIVLNLEKLLKNDID